MKINWLGSLRTKIIAWSFVPTVIILSAVAWFTFYSYQKVIGDLAIKQDREKVEEKATQVLNALNSMAAPSMLKIFLEIDSLHKGPLEIRAENILNQTPGLEVYDGGIFFVDSNGKVYKTQPEQPDLMGKDFSDTPAFRYLQERNNRTVPTDLFSIGQAGKEVVCTAAAMIGQKGETVGVGYYCYTIFPPTENTFSKTLNSVNLGPKIYLLDGNLHIIYSPDPSEMGKDLSKEPNLQLILQGQDKSGRFRIGGEEMLVSYTNPVSYPGTKGWMLLKEQRWAEIMQPSLPYQQLLFALLAMGVIVPALVTAYGVRHITDPILKLIQAARQVTAGQFKQRIAVKTGDEIEALSDQFNLMSAQLDDSYASLEKKVADRTRELAILNSIISVAGHSLKMQEILEDALNKTVEQMGFAAGAAFRIETDPTSPHLLAQRGLEPEVAAALASRYAISNQWNSPEAIPLVTALETDDSRAVQQASRLAQSGFHLLVSVPLSTKGQILGFFLLAKREPVPVTPEELSLLNSIGQQIGVAMENAHLYEIAEQSAIATERNRLARELHDAVTQTLFSANLIADVLPRVWSRNPNEGLQNLEELRQLTRGALAEMRTMLLEMRPDSLERAEIKPLLTQLADAFIGRVRVPVSLIVQGDCQLPREVKIVFYRVAQEALNNIAKHSGARHVEVSLESQPGHIHLFIKDDGLGFDLATIPPDHLGIAIMRERASSIRANLQINSQLGQGTTVELDWNSNPRD